MDWARVVELGLELPEVAESTWYGTPSLAVRRKSFLRLKEDGESVVFLLDDVDDQELLIRERPELYHITPHYEGYPAVLARLARLRDGECRVRIARAWLQKAPATLVARLEGERVAAKPARRAPRRRG